MCADCQNEHIEWCQAHLKTCREPHCEMCASIRRDIKDGSLWMGLDERAFNFTP
ncbi:hypothetical protein M2158_007953 [Streptomyces sp. SAI-144]|nr:hypothetical protein [Streptomyces sp. SAI-144]